MTNSYIIMNLFSRLTLARVAERSTVALRVMGLIFEWPTAPIPGLPVCVSEVIFINAPTIQCNYKTPNKMTTHFILPYKYKKSIT